MSRTTSRFMIIIVAAFCVTVAAAPVMAEDHPQPVQRAIDRMARVLEVPRAEIEVVSVEGVDWPDTSLGAPRPGYMYAQVITPGLKVILRHGDKRYEYHTDMDRRVVLASSNAEAPAEGQQPVPAAAKPCIADLAKRLNIKPAEISVVKIEPARFMDGSLGLPRPGMVYTKAITSGYHITLKTSLTEYLYAANDTTCAYAGPVDSRELSALYIEPIPNEPNLNGNLMQIALAGDNPRVLLEGVSDFRSQPNGSVTAIRRTSRSGHDLLYLAPGKVNDPVKLASSFAFTDAVVTEDGKSWAATVRPMVGGGWQLLQGKIGGEQQAPVALPDAGIPQRVYLHMGHPAVRMRQNDQFKEYELVNGAFVEGRIWPPPSEEMMLNKSETMVVTSETVDGKPVTSVIFQWFTGDQKVRARIENFEIMELTMPPSKRFLVMWGKRGDKRPALTVDIGTGEVLETLADSQTPVRVHAAPAPAPLFMKN